VDSASTPFREGPSESMITGGAVATGRRRRPYLALTSTQNPEAPQMLAWRAMRMTTAPTAAFQPTRSCPSQDPRADPKNCSVASQWRAAAASS